MTKGVNERELILGILMEITQHDMYSHLAIRSVLEKYQYLDKQERAFITRVSEGTLERMIELDYIIHQFSKVPVNKMKPVIRNILRMSVYQLKYMDSVPDSAVCNEAVKLAQRKGFQNLKGFVNGILRSISRELDSVVYPSEEKEPLRSLSVRYSMPEWILKKWEKTYGKETLLKMLEGFSEKRGTSIRVNLAKTSPEALTEALEKQGITVTPSPYLSYALEIGGYDYLSGIPEFQQGLFQVQDLSSMLVTEAAALEEGAYCLDICAAPGGKSLHLADKLQGTGHVEARDLTPYKVGLIEENMERTGVKNMSAVQQDACVFDAASVEKADVLLADLPCSGLGVLGKKTDIKYKMTEEKQRELVQLQRTMLEAASSYVKKGGTLIYSTCTIHQAENEENMRWFLEHFPYRLVSLDGCLPENLHSETTKEGYLQVLPGIHRADGFFIAKFERIS